MGTQEILTVTDDEVRAGNLGVLGLPASDALTFDGLLSAIVGDLLDTMHSIDNCIGLAAPQLGIGVRVAVVKARVLDEPNSLVLVNPRVVAARGKKDGKTEACMSLPGWGGLVRRKLDIDVVFHDQDGVLHERSVTGFPARVIQHEIDHLDGLLYVSRMRSMDELVKVAPRPQQSSADSEQADRQ